MCLFLYRLKGISVHLVAGKELRPLSNRFLWQGQGANYTSVSMCSLTVSAFHLTSVIMKSLKLWHVMDFCSLIMNDFLFKEKERRREGRTSDCFILWHYFSQKRTSGWMNKQREQLLPYLTDRHNTCTKRASNKALIQKLLQEFL